MEAPVLDRRMVEDIRNKVREQLVPLITDDYVYLDLPYHDNLGDMLIWEGTLSFLTEIKHKCLYSTGKDYYRSPRLKRGNVILLHGGGNFGDLWPEHQEFRKRIIEEFPDNPVIVMPQSVHYCNEENLRKDAEFFRCHPDVVICVRDRRSQQILEEVLPNRILLVPDMAFFVDPDKYGSPGRSDGGRVLFAGRLDKEAPENVDLSVIPGCAERHDWPSVEEYPSELYADLERVWHRCRRLKKWFGIDCRLSATDRFYSHKVRPHHVRLAVEFIGCYDEIWSTRLHITLLAMLMGKRVYVLDNNYCKTRNLLETWFAPSGTEKA